MAVDERSFIVGSEYFGNGKATNNLFSNEICYCRAEGVSHRNCLDPFSVELSGSENSYISLGVG